MPRFGSTWGCSETPKRGFPIKCSCIPPGGVFHAQNTIIGREIYFITQIMSQSRSTSDALELIPFSEGIKIQPLDSHTYSANLSRTFYVGTGSELSQSNKLELPELLMEHPHSPQWWVYGVMPHRGLEAPHDTERPAGFASRALRVPQQG